MYTVMSLSVKREGPLHYRCYLKGAVPQLSNIRRRTEVKKIRNRHGEMKRGQKMWERARSTHNMKSCSQHGWPPRTAMVVLLTFCTFRVTYVLNFSVKNINTSGHDTVFRFGNKWAPGGWRPTHLGVHRAWLSSLQTNGENKTRN